MKTNAFTKIVVGMVWACTPLVVTGQGLGVGGFGGMEVSTIPPGIVIDALKTGAMPLEALVPIVEQQVGAVDFPNVIIEPNARSIEVPALDLKGVELVDLMGALEWLVGIRHTWTDSGTAVGILMILAPEADNPGSEASITGFGSAIDRSPGQAFSGRSSGVGSSSGGMAQSTSPELPTLQLDSPTLPGVSQNEVSRVTTREVFAYVDPSGVKPPTAEPQVRVFAIGQLSMDSGAVIDVVKEVWSVADSEWATRENGPTISYHEGTGVLIVRGTEPRLKEVEQLVTELDKTEVQPKASAADPFGR